mmetsp:Transcript_8298/g.13693  ORF Transcript_8298/g.13693 Transcript_8298/m.13693 type:complete len:437 (-) Transcript_8298:124-1434(-)
MIFSISLLSILLTTTHPLLSSAVQDVQVNLDRTHLFRHMMDIGGHRNLPEIVQTEDCPGTPFLWKIIDDKSGNHVGFGLGTLHLPVDLVLTDHAYASIIHAVEDSCAVYGEIDMADMAVAAQIAECKGDLDSGAARISDIQDEDLRLKYESITREIATVVAAGAGADAAVVDSIHQNLLNVSLYNLLLFISYYNTPEYEQYFVPTLLGMPPALLDETILSIGRPNGGVEMVSTQCDILEELFVTPEELDEENLRLGLNQTLSGQINLYMCGDIDSFANAQVLAFEQSAMDSEFKSALLDERNEQMAAEIHNILKASDDRVLFAFGASHWTVGEKKLGNLLKGYGYSLEYVPNYAKDDAEDMSNEECRVVFNSISGEFDLIETSNSTGSTPTINESPSASPVSSPSEGTASPVSGATIKAKASIFCVMCAFGSLYLY